MNETELEAMVVRLLGDSTEYVKMMQDAEKQTKQTAGEALQAAKSVEASGTSLQNFASNVASSVKQYGNSISSGITTPVMDVTAKLMALGNAAWSWLEAGVNNFVKAEGNALRLKAAIEANGRASEPVIANYSKFAAALAEQTTTTKNSAMAMFQQAESMGLSDDAAKRAVKNSIALAAAKGGEAESYLRQTIMLERGHAGRLAMILGLREEGGQAEQVAKAQEMLGKMYSVATAEAESAGGQITKLQKDYAGLQKQFGEIIGQGVKPIVQLLRFAVSGFQGLSKEMKTAIVVTVALFAAFVLLSVGIAIAGKVFNFFFGGIGIIAGVLITALAAAAAAAGGIVVAVGGISGIFADLKAKAIAAWEWLMPVRQALNSFFTELGAAAKRFATYAKEVLTEAWAYITQNANVNWEQVRDTIRDAILFAEFSLTHLQQVAELAWAGIKYFAVKALNAILDNIGLVLAGPQILALMVAHGVNWKDLFLAIVQWHGDLLFKMLEAAAKFNTMHWDILRGKKPQFLQIIQELGGGDLKFSAKGVKLTGLQDLEKRLKDEFEALKGITGEEFEEFKTRKLEEFAKETAVTKESLDTNVTAPTAAANKELHKFDAALFGSAEAMSRIAAYHDNLEGPIKSAPGAAAAGGVQPAPLQLTVPDEDDSAIAVEVTQAQLLKQIANNTREMADTDPIVAEPVNLL